MGKNFLGDFDMKKLLFVLPQIPYPPVDGGKQGLYYRIKMLSRIFDVYVYMINIEASDISEQELKQAFCFTKEIFVSDRQNTSIQKASLGKKVLEGFNWLFSGSPRGAQIYQAPVYKKKLKEIVETRHIDIISYEFPFTTVMGDIEAFHQKDIRQVCVFHNIEHKIYADIMRSKGVPKLVSNIEVNRIRHIEKNAIDRMDGVASISSEDAAYFSSNTTKTMQYIPSLLTKREAIWDQEEQNDKYIIFPGALSFAPNYNGIRWFYASAFQQFLKKYNQHSDLKLLITGKAPEHIKRIVSDYSNVQLTGFVSDDELHQLYKHCRFAIVPIIDGAGVKMKILDLMSYGVPVIATKFAALGIGAEKAIREVATGDEFCQAMAELLEDKKKRVQMSQAEHAFYEETYASDAAVKKWADFYNGGVAE